MTAPKSLAELRREQLLSKQELADAAGVSYATIRSIEKGETKGLRMRTIRQITEALEVDHRDVTEFVTALRV